MRRRRANYASPVLQMMLVVCALEATAQPTVRVSVNGGVAYPFDPNGPFGAYVCESGAADTTTRCGCDAEPSGLTINIVDDAASDVLVCDECFGNLIHTAWHSTSPRRLVLTSAEAARRTLDHYVAALQSVRFETSDQTADGSRSLLFEWGAPLSCMSESVTLDVHASDECMAASDDAGNCIRVDASGNSVSLSNIFQDKDCSDYAFAGGSVGSAGCDCTTPLADPAVTLTVHPTMMPVEPTVQCSSCSNGMMITAVPYSMAYEVTAAPAPMVYPMLYRYVLERAGGATLADMMSTLDSAVISFAASTPLEMAQKVTINWAIGSVTYLPETGSFYKVVSVPADGTTAWYHAQRACAQTNRFGMLGYLATITTHYEDVATGTLIMSEMASPTSLESLYLGASDIGAEGQWRWITGPEGCPPYDYSAIEPAARTSCNIYPIDEDVKNDAACVGVVDPQCSASDGTLFASGTRTSATTVIGTYPGTIEAFKRTADYQPNEHSEAGSGDCRDQCGQDFMSWQKDAGPLDSHKERWYDVATDAIIASGYVCEWSPSTGTLCTDLSAIRGTVCVIPMFSGSMPCPSCGSSCGADGQVCVDPDTGSPAASLGNWECRCPSGTSGVGQQTRATCLLDECADKACAEGQHCEEVDQAWNVTDDWGCQCNTPATGYGPTANASKCVLNECLPHSNCSTCISAAGCGPLQECMDPKHDSLHTQDWKCLCVGEYTGEAALRNATCMLDECTADCPSCLLPGSCAAGQECVDEFHAADSTEDWACRCIPPFSSETVKKRGNATCILDECEQHADCETCITEACPTGRSCADRISSHPGTQDWVCDCDAGEVGDSEACLFDECLAYFPCGTGQNCMDADSGTLIDNLHNYVCECVAPLVGDAAMGGPAVCGPPLPTPPPPTPAPQVLPQGETVEKAGETAAAVSVVAGGAGPALTTVVVLGSCDARDVNGYPWALHPTRLVVFDSEAAGAVVGNCSISLGFWLVVYTIFRAVSHALYRNGKGPAFMQAVDTQGFVRFPSAPLVVFIFLYQGTSLASMELVIRNPSTPAFLVGLMGVAFCIAIPFAVLRAISKDVPDAAFYKEDTADYGWAVRFLIGDGEWVSRRRDTHWVQRWACVVRTYRQSTVWFLFLELSAAFAISALQSVKVEKENTTGCAYVKLLTGVVFLMQLALEVYLWPHCHARNNWLDSIVYTLQSSGMFVMAAAYFAGGAQDHWGFPVAGALLLGAVVVVIVRTLLDMIGLLYVLVTRRRMRLQESCFELTDAQDVFRKLRTLQGDVNDVAAFDGTNLYSPVIELRCDSNHGTFSHWSPPDALSVTPNFLAQSSRSLLDEEKSVEGPPVVTSRTLGNGKHFGGFDAFAHDSMRKVPIEPLPAPALTKSLSETAQSLPNSPKTLPSLKWSQPRSPLFRTSEPKPLPPSFSPARQSGLLRHERVPLTLQVLSSRGTRASDGIDRP
eukprot:TRINITY_DN24803_c0_g1_i1.p1 TRINITY_DN24803_c0_g1~~TRINITY_DN24803_c0_g1_i1.p1  ORF type:complete len:1459 (+),score=106.63 TRINITY_DN24803_c0_g1_i1:95-4471(+)